MALQRKKRLMTVTAICIGVVASIGLYWHFKPKAKFEDKFLAKLQKYSPPITELQSLPQVPPKYHSESLEQFKQLQHQFQPNYHRQNTYFIYDSWFDYDPKRGLLDTQFKLTTNYPNKQMDKTLRQALQHIQAHYIGRNVQHIAWLENGVLVNGSDVWQILNNQANLQDTLAVVENQKLFRAQVLPDRRHIMRIVATAAESYENYGIAPLPARAALLVYDTHSRREIRFDFPNDVFDIKRPTYWMMPLSIRSDGKFVAMGHRYPTTLFQFHYNSTGGISHITASELKETEEKIAYNHQTIANYAVAICMTDDAIYSLKYNGKLHQFKQKEGTLEKVSHLRGINPDSSYFSPDCTTVITARQCAIIGTEESRPCHEGANEKCLGLKYYHSRTDGIPKPQQYACAGDSNWRDERGPKQLEPRGGVYSRLLWHHQYDVQSGVMKAVGKPFSDYGVWYHTPVWLNHQNYWLPIVPSDYAIINTGKD
ncbi:hypothetical protein [Alysiella crassa]|uniref:hypothetical protein n=1 Tax=Alysiella crassa TaxID=153491 RepID=UPI000553C1C8|nr:hypothetical protein [Alysiella crassa]